MNLYDPRRKKINNLPELVGRHFAVPRLCLMPQQDGITQISAMIPSDATGKFSSRQVLRTIPDEKIPAILSQYRNDPEGTLEILFSISLEVLEPNDKQLARDLAKTRNMPNDSLESIETQIEKANSIQL